MSEHLELLTVEEVAQILRVTPRTIYRKVELNQIPGAFRVGSSGSFRFVKDKILNWINAQAKVV